MALCVPYPAPLLLKAANVFLTEDGSADGSIKLGDFGISKTLSTQTNLAVTACGTPFYFSPELINAHAYRYVTQTRDPVRVQTVVSVKKLNADGKPFVVPILYTTAEFLHQGQELTLVRFKLTEAGELVKNSVHSIYQELRTKQHRKGK